MIIFLIAIQVLVSIPLWFPVVLKLRSLFIKKKEPDIDGSFLSDFGIIITAYKQLDLIEDVVYSVLQSTYGNYMIYVVADACEQRITFDSERVVMLYPDTILAGNTRSHFYAVNRFVRAHNVITIIDSDNLVDKNYLEQMHIKFQQGYKAIQGVRTARNLNSFYACLDETGDMYYRFIDRKLLFESGSSASLAGSGMSFTTALYKECLENVDISGAGFDKVLQYELLCRDYTIAFAENAVVYDGKTTKSDQLVKQRARWINTWLKYWVLALKLLDRSARNLSWNQFAFSIMLLRPPLFVLFFIVFVSILSDIIFLPYFLIFWLAVVLVFMIVFFTALSYFKSGKIIYLSLLRMPRFIWWQVVAACKAKSANKLSVATEHKSSDYK